MSRRPGWLTLTAFAWFGVGVVYVASVPLLLADMELDPLSWMGYPQSLSVPRRLLLGLASMVGGTCIGVGARPGWWVAAVFQVFLTAHWMSQGALIAHRRAEELGAINGLGGSSLIFLVLTLAGAAVFWAFGRDRALHYFGYSRRRSIPFLIGALVLGMGLAQATGYGV